jgi:hypothetical protein
MGYGLQVARATSGGVWIVIAPGNAGLDVRSAQLFRYSAASVAHVRGGVVPRKPGHSACIRPELYSIARREVVSVGRRRYIFRLRFIPTTLCYDINVFRVLLSALEKDQTNKGAPGARCSMFLCFMFSTCV